MKTAPSSPASPPAEGEGGVPPRPCLSPEYLREALEQHDQGLQRKLARRRSVTAADVERANRALAKRGVEMEFLGDPQRELRVTQQALERAVPELTCSWAAHNAASRERLEANQQQEHVLSVRPAAFLTHSRTRTSRGRPRQRNACSKAGSDDPGGGPGDDDAEAEHHHLARSRPLAAMYAFAAIDGEQRGAEGEVAA